MLLPSDVTNRLIGSSRRSIWGTLQWVLMTDFGLTVTVWLIVWLSGWFVSNVQRDLVDCIHRTTSCLIMKINISIDQCVFIYILHRCTESDVSDERTHDMRCVHHQKNWTNKQAVCRLHTSSVNELIGQSIWPASEKVAVATPGT